MDLPYLEKTYIRLDWKAIHAVFEAETSHKLTDLLCQHNSLFFEGLGKISPYKATLQVASTLALDSSKHPMFFAIKAAIEEELNKLESSVVIEKVVHCNWEAPIVPVPKKNGKFGICGDYKVTINRELRRGSISTPQTRQSLCSAGRQQEILEPRFIPSLPALTPRRRFNVIRYG